jgi:hypothetical protein
MHKKLVIAIKTLSWSKVSNTPKNTMLSSKQWYSKHSFLHAYQTPLKYIIVLKNTMILSQNFKNTLFPNTPLIVNERPTGLSTGHVVAGHSNQLHAATCTRCLCGQATPPSDPHHAAVHRVTNG